MTINYYECYLVGRERAVDAMHEAEQWRLRRAIRRSSQPSPEESAMWMGLRRLILRFRATRSADVQQPSPSRLSSQRG